MPVPAAPSSAYGRVVRRSPTPAAAALTRLGERVRAASLSGRVAFLPYLGEGNYTEETPEMRAAYRTMLKSEVVKAALMGKVFAVAELDLQIQPADEGVRYDKDVATFCRYAFDHAEGGPPAIAFAILMGLLIDGFCLCDRPEKIYDRGRWKGYSGYSEIVPKDTSAVQLITDEFLKPTSFRNFRYGDPQTYDVRDFVYATYMPLFRAPGGMSDFRAPYSPYWFLDTVRKLRLIHLEKFTSPLLKGTYSNINDKPALDAVLQQAASRTWFSIPENLQIEAMSIATRGEAEFAEAERDFKEAIALGISGAFLQMLTASAGSSIRGSAKTQQTTAELFVWYLSALLANVYTSQLIPPLVRTNFSPDADYPTCTLGGVNDGDLKPSADLDEVLQRVGLKLSRKAMYKRFNREPPEDPQDELQPPQQGQPQGPQPGGGAGPPSPFAEGGGNDRPADPPSGPAPAGDQVALGGADGAKAEQLLAEAKRQGTQALSEVTATALRRLLQGGPRQALRARTLFTADERKGLADTLASVTASADLLGRSRIRDRQRATEAGKTSGGPRKFSEQPTGFAAFAEPVPLLAPLEALKYFTRLEPLLGVDPHRWGPQQERQAFTLAAATEETLLDRVQELLARRLETGQKVSAAPAEVEALLDEAGVTPKNPQYSEMVTRTNLMDAYNTGAQEELADVADFFPVWRYSNPDDNRSRPHHAARNGKYWPSSVPFTRVRGTGIEDTANDRCSFTPVDRYEWAELVKAGVKVERA